jgi:hypothetical protein
MAEIEVGFGAVFGDEYLTVLIRAHCARIDVEIRIALHDRYIQPARLEQHAQRGCGNPFAERRQNPSGNEYKSRHLYLLIFSCS